MYQMHLIPCIFILQTLASHLHRLGRNLSLAAFNLPLPLILVPRGPHPSTLLLSLHPCRWLILLLSLQTRPLSHLTASSLISSPGHTPRPRNPRPRRHRTALPAKKVSRFRLHRRDLNPFSDHPPAAPPRNVRSVTLTAKMDLYALPYISPSKKMLKTPRTEKRLLQCCMTVKPESLARHLKSDGHKRNACLPLDRPEVCSVCNIA
jgi:hypothetical protein